MTENLLFTRISARLSSLDRKVAWLSRESGVSYEKLRNLGRRPEATLSGEDLLSVARTLGVTPEWLAVGDDSPIDVLSLRAEVRQELDLLSEEELRALLTGLRATRAQNG